MQRVTLFLLIIAVAVLAVISTFGTFLPRQMMMPGMRGMMGEESGMGNFLWPSILSASTVVVLVAVTYVILFPSIRYSKEVQTKPEVPVTSANDLDPMSIVMRVVRPDERAALEVLRSSGGICLQKDITYKTGVSKLKTHRVIARLAERGIIQVRKIGKTNEISVPAWLGMRQSAEKPAASDES